MPRTMVIALMLTLLAPGFRLVAQDLPSPERIVQDSLDRSEPDDRFDLVKAQLEGSYFMILSGWGELQRNLFFEGNIAPHFAAAWKTGSVVFTPKLILRMENDSTGSAPVRTPSYMPRLAMYLWGSPIPQTENSFQFVSFLISHHSNGQSGPFYDSITGLHNLEDGSFSTNFVEVGFHSVGDGTIFDRLLGFTSGGTSWEKIAFRAHIPVNEDPELRSPEGDDQYGRYRLIYSQSARATLFRRIIPFDTKSNTEISYVLDRHFRSEPLLTRNRLNVSYSLLLTPRMNEDFGVYLNYYRGQDYYNIWYDKRIDVFRLGISTNSVTTIFRPR